VAVAVVLEQAMVELVVQVVVVLVWLVVLPMETQEQ
jgi:hypothetical protein